MEFLRNLEFLLAKHNMSRAELARNIGIAPSTVNAWFNKSCEGVSLKTLKDIASYFNVTLEDSHFGKSVYRYIIAALMWRICELATCTRCCCSIGVY